MAWFYISFATDAGFLGATCVKGQNAKRALARATSLGINPGGEAAILRVPRGKERSAGFLAMRDKLLNLEQMEQQGGRRLRDLPPALKQRFWHEAECACENCNPAKRST